MDKRVVFLATVDGDLRVGNLVQQKQAVRRLSALFDELGLRGCVTWFVNENDFHWTAAHGDLLLEIVARGDALGIHDHFDTHDAQTYQQALALASRSLQRVKDFCHRAGLSVEVIAHRNGCFLQSQAYYRVLRALGYRVVSDIWPGQRWCGRMIRAQEAPQKWIVQQDSAFACDHSGVPLAADLWWHDQDNWFPPGARAGAFLQVPVISAPYIEPDRMAEAVAGTSGSTAYLTWDTHPYNIQHELTGEIDEGMVTAIGDRLAEVRQRFGPEFIHVNHLWQRLRERW